MKDAYPVWVCAKCGEKYGNRIPHMATWHNGICGVCNRPRAVTEPRDYGHLKPGWRDEHSFDEPT